MVLNLCPLESFWREIPFPSRTERGGEIFEFLQIPESKPSCSCLFSLKLLFLNEHHALTPEEQEIPVRCLKLLCCQLLFHLSLVNILIFVSGHGVFLSSHSSVTLCAVLWNLLSVADSRCLIWPLPLKCCPLLCGLYYVALGHRNPKVKSDIF